MTDEPAASAEDPPRKKKRKKRKPTEAAPPAASRAPGASADERPLFARDFPTNPELDRLVAAFEAGNYALVRTDAANLVHATKDEAVRRAARQLLTRLQPDKTAVFLLGVAVALLVFVSYWHWAHPHGG